MRPNTKRLTTARASSVGFTTMRSSALRSSTLRSSSVRSSPAKSTAKPAAKSEVTISGLRAQADFSPRLQKHSPNVRGSVFAVITSPIVARVLGRLDAGLSQAGGLVQQAPQGTIQQEASQCGTLLHPLIQPAPRQPSQQRYSSQQRYRLTWLPLLAAAIAANLGPGGPSALAQANTTASPLSPLYTLQTQCTVRGTEQRCQVEAFDGKDATVYRTTINGSRTSFRLIDRPDNRAAQLWDSEGRSWTALNRLTLDFATSTVCLNGDQLCMVNPNYFASLQQEHPGVRRDLIMARFDSKTGLLSAICYSREACNAGF